MMKPRFLTLVGMIAMAAVARIMPHPWNVSPVAAMALFGGAHFESRKMAFGVPLAAMLVSDLFVGFHSLMLVIYAAFALTVVIGFWIQQEMSIRRVAMGSITASVLFFIVTNFATWAEGVLYPRTSAGLVDCFVKALPFFRNTCLGDLIYSGALFGAFYLAERTFPALREIPAAQAG